MSEKSSGIDLWKMVVGFGGVLVVTGAGATVLVLIVGGLILALLGFVYAFWERHEWKRPPKLPRGITSAHYPLKYEPEKFPYHPHYQELALFFRKRVSSPELRVFCTAPVRHIEGKFLHGDGTDELFDFSWTRKSIDAVTVLPYPFRPIEPSTFLTLWLYSDVPIRVRRIRQINSQVKNEPPPTGEEIDELWLKKSADPQIPRTDS